MDAVSTISLYAALLTTGLMAGLYLAFSIAVMPGIARSDDDTFVAAMRGMNAAILNPVFGLVFGGPLVLGVVAVATRLPDEEGIGWTAGALVLYVATLVITGVVNVPLNNQLESTEPPRRRATSSSGGGSAGTSYEPCCASAPSPPSRSRSAEQGRRTLNGVMIRGLVGPIVSGVLLAGCSVESEDGGRSATDEPGRAGASTTPSPSERPSSTATPSPSPTPASPTETAQLAGDGRARLSSLGIPAIGLAGLQVVPYRGSPDDAPGTQIQNGGVAASPGGPDGGVGPGGVGNFIVTAHRTSSTRAFARLPELRAGDRVHVDVGARKAKVRYTYEIVRTRSTSFRSPESLERQSAPVPGRPGREPTRAMVTLSTCATPEDHAQGNFWADEFGNPEHRIDKIGVLVARRTL